jgi:hypothetical protein
MHKQFLTVLTLISFVNLLHGYALAAAGFEITGTGKLVHFESTPPGAKPPTTNITAATIAACITGDLSLNGCSTNLDTDGAGKAFLFIIDQTHIGVGTTTNCANATILEGLVGGNGTFMFSGRHSFNGNDTDILVQGTILSSSKNTFPTDSPLGIKAGSILAISTDLHHFGTGKFSTVTGSNFSAVCP